LLPFVLLRAVSSTFLSRGDTATPVKALVASVVINVALKVLLMDRYAQVGLAFATSVGVWVNFALLVWFATRRKLLTFDDRLRSSVVKLVLAGMAVAAILFVAAGPIVRQSESFGALRFVVALAVLGTLSAVLYGGAVAFMFGPRWFREFGGGRGV
jgi:putative peptidoglycan lipid II flippase